MARQQRLALIREIQDRRNSKVICYLTSDRRNAAAQVAKDQIPILFEHLRPFRDDVSVDVMMFTTGGDTLAGFGLARLVREFSSKVGVLIPHLCHSAGTLFALGANEIVMTRLGSLSPIDPSIVGPLNPAIEKAPGQKQAIPLSVESVAGFQSLVTEDWNIRTEPELAGAFRLLAEKVHPIALGNVFRSRQQIQVLAEKLLGAHRTDTDNVQRIIETLAKGLGSHDYLISRTEAREVLGTQLAERDDDFEDLVWRLYKDFADEMTLGIEFDAQKELNQAMQGGQQGPVPVKVFMATIESELRTDVCDQDLLLSQVQVPPAPGRPAQLGLQAVVARSGWRYYN